MSDLGQSGQVLDVAATMVGCSEDKKQLPPAIITDLQAPLPASHPRNSGSKLPQLVANVCWERDPVEGESPWVMVPALGRGWGGVSGEA